MILVDEKGEIQYFQNLDSVKCLDPEYLENQLTKMKAENEPIKVSYIGNNKQFIYYRNSDLLYKLTYYPIALILVLFLFLGVIYMFYNLLKLQKPTSFGREWLRKLPSNWYTFVFSFRLDRYFKNGKNR